MNEKILYFIWEHQYFDSKQLQTTARERVIILNRGIRNGNAGPDFLHAKIIIDNLEWVGHIEVHVRSSDWIRHGHNRDPAYENVILHLVYEDDEKGNYSIPKAELKNIANHKFIERYQMLTTNDFAIPCKGLLGNVEFMIILSMQERALINRLQRKGTEILDLLKKNNFDWEETTYQVLAKSFGFKINSEPFMKLAQNMPLKYICKHLDRIECIEALLFGQAGFLEEGLVDGYGQNLKKEYLFLSHKYEFGEKKLKKQEWMFLRLRPANFPTLRMAQLAQLLHNHDGLFSKLIQYEDLKEIKNLLTIEQSDYWKRHYLFDVEAEGVVPNLGERGKELIIINVVCNLLSAYAMYTSDEIYIQRAMNFLQQISAEENKITQEWKSMGMALNNSYDSQSFIELYNSYCTNRHCAQCAIGHDLIASSKSMIPDENN